MNRRLRTKEGKKRLTVAASEWISHSQRTLTGVATVSREMAQRNGSDRPSPCRHAKERKIVRIRRAEFHRLKGYTRPYPVREGSS